MATTPVSQALARGGAFLVSSTSPEDVFTPADLTDDQRLLGRTIEEFLAKEVIPHIPELEKHKEGLMPELIRKAGEVGLLGAGIPEEYGGAALDKISMTIVSEKLSAYPSFMVSFGAHTGIGSIPIIYFGTEAQKKKYLPKIAAGELLSCYALSEPQAGSDALAARTRAVLSPDGKSWLLTGQKMWITSGGFSDIYRRIRESRRRQVLILHRRARDARLFRRRRRKQDGHPRQLDRSAVFRERRRFPRKTCCTTSAAATSSPSIRSTRAAFRSAPAARGEPRTYLAIASKYAKERTAFGKSIAEFGLIKAKLGEMAIRTYALESMIYRSAGTIEAAVASAGTDKVQQAMQALEEYAIESSISKVVGSETLDYCVDEAVQIFGGYGFHEDYPVARMYRDSRINRIFEGTNEINRLVIIQMLMKRAMSGVLPLIPAAMKLGEELLSGPSFEETPSGPFAEEEKSLAQAKKIFLLAAGAAVQKFRDQLADEQEIVGALANIVMDVYAIESSLRRAQKTAAAKGQSAALMGEATTAFTYDAMDRIEKEARTALAAIADGDTLTTQLAALRRLAKHAPIDAIAIRRRLADAVLAQDRYPFDGR